MQRPEVIYISIMHHLWCTYPFLLALRWGQYYFSLLLQTCFMEAVWFPLWLVNSFVMSLINIFHVKTRCLNAPWWPKEKKIIRQFCRSVFQPRCFHPARQLSALLHSMLLRENNSDCTQLTTPINNRESRQAAGWTRGIQVNHDFKVGRGQVRWVMMMFCMLTEWRLYFFWICRYSVNSR